MSTASSLQSHIESPRHVQVDKNALPSPAWDAIASGNEYVAPEGELEEKLHEVWTSELGLESLSTRTNFFKAGGTSLLAGVVAFQLSKALNSSVPATAVFGHPTIASLAFHLSDKPQGAGISKAPYSGQDKVKLDLCALQLLFSNACPKCEQPASLKCCLAVGQEALGHCCGASQADSGSAMAVRHANGMMHVSQLRQIIKQMQLQQVSCISCAFCALA